MDGEADAGGEFYWRSFCLFRYPPSNAETGDNQRHAKVARQLREGEIAARLLEAGFSADPADDMRIRLTDAIRDYNDWQTFGLPYSGGTRDQPVNWLLKMRCVSASQQAAQSEIDDERQRESEAQAEQQRQEAGANS